MKAMEVVALNGVEITGKLKADNIKIKFGKKVSDMEVTIGGKNVGGVAFINMRIDTRVQPDQAVAVTLGMVPLAEVKGAKKEGKNKA